MNVRWLWLDHFPAELDLSQEQKKSARARASLHRKREPNYRGAGRRYALMFVPIFFIGFACYFFWLQHLIETRQLGARSPFITGLAPSIIVYGIMAFALHRTRTPFIRRALRDMKYEICEECGYWLRGLSDDVKQCPECGADRASMRNDGDDQS